MECELCQREAVGACRACGAAFCASHAPPFCFRCATAVGAVGQDTSSRNTYVSGDKTPRFSGTGYLQCESVGRPTVRVADAGPPACYRCRALARRICRNCQALYCPEHAGGPELCDVCARSGRLGLLVLAGVGAVLGLLVLWSQLPGRP